MLKGKEMLKGYMPNVAPVFGRVLTITICICLCGCRSIGPDTITRDRSSYTDAISDSWKEQMLLNIVKIRYADVPVFMDVSSVINQYSLETELYAGVEFDARNNQTFFGRGKYTDRPTVTYSPLTGDKFTRNLLTPIPPTAILNLVQGGWPVDRVLSVCVNSINGIDNRSGNPAFMQEADAEFYQLVSELRAIQQEGGVTVRLEKEGEEVKSIMFLEPPDNEEMGQVYLRLKKLLHLNPEANEFRLVYGRVPKFPDELAILSRSLMEIMLEISSYIDLPQEELDEGRVLPSLSQSVEENKGIPPLIRIHSSTTKPADVYLSIPYRGYWFYIDDKDPRSKGMLTFMMILFSLAETGGPSNAPILTIPAG